LYGNPHSDSKPSKITGQKCDAVRARLLKFFGADPNEYDLIFVANATAALKLVMESLRDLVSQQNSPKRGEKGGLLRRKGRHPSGFNYVYHRDAHTSLVGIRAFSSTHRCFTTEEEVESWIDDEKGITDGITLFGYPGQSNMTGRRLPVDWLAKVRRSPRASHTFTLLDAAALATSSRLRISEWQPDLVAVSFYKIFGQVDLGALIVHKARAGPLLKSRRYFGGGTVDMVIAVNGDWHMKKVATIHDANEDGTIPFHDILCLDHCLDTMDRVYGGIENVGKHVANLTKILYDKMIALRHHNGEGLVEFYLDGMAQYGDAKSQGGTIAFNIVRANGQYVGYADVERAADEWNIYLRSGGLCNPGGVAEMLRWSPEEMKAAYQYGHRCSKPIQGIMGRPTGVVRASLGACSSSEDIARLVAFLRETYLEEVAPQQAPRQHIMTDSARLSPEPMRSLVDETAETKVAGNGRRITLQPIFLLPHAQSRPDTGNTAASTADASRDTAIVGFQAAGEQVRHAGRKQVPDFSHIPAGLEKIQGETTSTGNPDDATGGRLAQREIEMAASNRTSSKDGIVRSEIPIPSLELDEEVLSVNAMHGGRQMEEKGRDQKPTSVAANPDNEPQLVPAGVSHSSEDGAGRRTCEHTRHREEAEHQNGRAFGRYLSRLFNHATGNRTRSGGRNSARGIGIESSALNYCTCGKGCDSGCSGPPIIGLRTQTAETRGKSIPQSLAPSSGGVPSSDDDTLGPLASSSAFSPDEFHGDDDNASSKYAPVETKRQQSLARKAVRTVLGFRSRSS
jgi:molybdenum cofactor sulfurtransferase